MEFSLFWPWSYSRLLLAGAVLTVVSGQGTVSEHHVPDLRGGSVELQLRALEDAAAEHVAHQQHGAPRLQGAGRQQLRVPRHV